ncbi:hypothetical protein G7Y79_00026g058560 [Physcia stellaris]|nr:hypothetical protein G7Y79_00026g058560 [Physcia stellaris]
MTRYLAKQPGKAFLLLYFIPKYLRPHSLWTYHHAVGNALLKLWFSFASTIEFQTTKSLDPGPEKKRFLVLNPAKPDFYSGFVEDRCIQSVPISGMWYPKEYESAIDTNKRIVLHFHGGAYVLGGVRPKEGGWGPEVLAKAVDGMVLCPQYRLSSQYKGRFPAALQDGITAYQYLLNQGIPSSDIIISGDSAGANLALALLRCLSENGGSLPLPFAALLWSPWLDLAADPYAVNAHRNRKTDYITPVLVEWGLRTYRPPFYDANHPYLTPLNNPFATKVPIFMQYGTAEVLLDEQRAFYSLMEEVAGNSLERLEIFNVPHNTFLGGPILGFERG